MVSPTQVLIWKVLFRSLKICWHFIDWCAFWQPPAILMKKCRLRLKFRLYFTSRVVRWSTDKKQIKENYLPNSMAAVSVCLCVCVFTVEHLEEADRVRKSNAGVAMVHRPLTEIEWAAAIHALRWRPERSPDQCTVRRRSSNSSSGGGGWCCCFSDDRFATSSELGCVRDGTITPWARLDARWLTPATCYKT